MERGCWSSFQRSIMSSLLTVWSVAHNNDRIEVLMQRFVYFLIQPFHLHRDICLFWSCFAYGRCVDVCFSYGCMLNVFLQRRPGMPLGPRQSIWLQHLFDLGKSNTNAARTTNYCPVLDKATCIFPLYQIPERKGCNPEKKRIMSFSLPIEHVLKGPLTKRRWKSDVSWLALAFSCVAIITFISIFSFFLLYWFTQHSFNKI